MARRRKTDKETWTDEERLALFCQKGTELIRHPFVCAMHASGGVGFTLKIGPPDAGGRRPLTVSIRGANSLEVQAVEALVRLFTLKTEPVALDQIGGVVGRAAPQKADAVRAVLKAYRRNLARRPSLGPAELKTSGYTDDFTFGELLDLHLYGNATHVEKGPRAERARLLGNAMAEPLFGQVFYQRALFIVAAAVKDILDILNGAQARAL